MRIRRIQLYRFRGFDDLQLIFPPKENLTVFIGQNGSGKTSLLDGISMILQDSLYKHHKYEKVEWNNPLNVQNPHLYGSIALGLQGPRRSYEFSQSLSASRTRFISEDKLVLEKNRDLTDGERMEHYGTQAKMAFDERLYEKALEEYLKLASMFEKISDKDNVNLAFIYQSIGLAFERLKNYSQSLEYLEKSLSIQQIILTPTDIKLSMLYSSIGMVYLQLGNDKLAIINFEKCLQIQEIISISESSIIGTLSACSVAYIGIDIEAV